MADLREIVLDTETTGLRVHDGHRVIEIGCVELINKNLTAQKFHTYLQVTKKVDPQAFAVHGISDDFLRDKPIFSKIAADFLQFIGDSNLIIHNAAFDMKFLNQELEICGRYPIPTHRAIDTLFIARKKFPGSPVSLDALCKRFNISLHNREKHGALIDAELLALVYIEMYSGNQGTIKLEQARIKNELMANTRREIRMFCPSEEEIKNHHEIMQLINKHS